MSVTITDCTIRDGGYLFNKNSDPEFVKGIMKGLADAGINFVETGFLQTNVTEETLVYKDSVDARRYLPEDRKIQTSQDFVITVDIHQKILMTTTEIPLSGLEFLLQSMKLMHLLIFVPEQ